MFVQELWPEAASSTKWIMWLDPSCINSIPRQKLAAVIRSTAKEHKSLVVKVLENLFLFDSFFIVSLFLLSRLVFSAGVLSEE